ncbi:phosphate acetyltransferase [Propioniciclava sp. MC1595]|uniref:phosphate acetyltransferase n=1 Tax=unclassified Propioniciclava TaxID=2642922 RepID=UPI0016042F87|nr:MULTISPECIES: phosphate acetyltransferase [unclassified Propioniciclava]MBB1495177.1 phosphate acetyltransferase [Propioniciclava sp. MC1595]MBB1502558.1 phosphate acetyltransferase [Propioniciclava sp. MC1683]QTE26309.1 phosphate acetyltransferase [Propioniciclava sp. MC1595]
MTRSIYVMAPEGQTGKSVVALGIVDALTREVESVGVFRPIIKGTEPDQILTALLRQPAVQQEYDESYGVTYQDVRRDADEALATIVRRYGEVAGHFDAVVILGSDYRDALGAPELGLNARIAANLNAPVAFCVSARGRSPEEVVQYARSSLEELKKHHATTIAVIPTRVPTGHEAEYANAVRAAWPDVVAGVIPDHRVLAAPLLGAQVKAVEGRLIVGRDDMLQHDSQTVIVGAMTLPNLLARLEPEATVIMPGDRTEMIPGLLMAQTSGAFPQLAGLILTGGYAVPHSIQQLITSVPHELPIAMTELGTYTTAERLFRLEGMMTSSDRKTELGRRLFSEFVDAGALLGAMHVDRAEIRTPVMFEYQLNEMARRDKRRIVLPESGDDRILEAASIVLRRGTADIILLGDPTEVKAHALASGYSLEGAEIIDMATPELVERFSEEYMRLRAAKGVTVEQAKEKMADPSYFGTMMVHLGLADGMVSGAANTTANTIRPSLEFVKTKPGVSVVSSSFLMCMSDRVDVYGDCAVNPDPTAEQLADIAISSAQTAVAFGIEPRVAMLSYSTGSSGAGADVDKVREATDLVRLRAPHLKVEGPIQFDAAVDPDVGSKKMPGSDVAGQATVFIFPDLNTGNNTYKAVQRSAGALAVGPVLQGLNKPVNDLSRGALVDDIVNTIAITAIQAQNN